MFISKRALLMILAILLIGVLYTFYLVYRGYNQDNEAAFEAKNSPSLKSLLNQ